MFSKLLIVFSVIFLISSTIIAQETRTLTLSKDNFPDLVSHGVHLSGNALYLFSPTLYNLTSTCGCHFFYYSGDTGSMDKLKQFYSMILYAISNGLSFDVTYEHYQGSTLSSVFFHDIQINVNGVKFKLN